MTFIGEAWRGIQRFVNDARIDVDFPRYEGEQRAIHESAASRRFDTSQLEREIAEIRRAAEAEGRSVFDPQIREVKSSIDAIQPAIKELRAQLELLSRDYRNAIKLVELIDTLDEGVERHGL